MTGVAWLNDRIYMICYNTNTVFVFSNKDPYNRLDSEDWTIPEMLYPEDIVASIKNNALFIVDPYNRNNCVWKIQMPEVRIQKWLIGGLDYTLSTTPSGNLFMLSKKQTVGSAGKTIWCVNTYSAVDACLLKSIPLPSNMKYPEHVQQLSRSMIILYRKEQIDEWAVSELTVDGRIVRSFHSSAVDSIPFKNAWHIAIDEKGNVFVADRDNNRVVMIDSKLKKSKTIKTFSNNFYQRWPSRLCYVKNRRELIVGHGVKTFYVCSLRSMK